MEVFLLDNTGHRVPPADAPDPVVASGQTLTNASANTDTSATVVAGATYALTSFGVGATKVGSFFLGVATIETAANIIWACPFGGTITIVIPSGVTTLHYGTDVANSLGYLRRLTA